MAELCKECFVNIFLDENEKKDFTAGKIKVRMSDAHEMCEGCGRISKTVVSVKRDKKRTW